MHPQTCLTSFYYCLGSRFVRVIQWTRAVSLLYVSTPRCPLTTAHYKYHQLLNTSSVIFVVLTEIIPQQWSSWWVSNNFQSNIFDMLNIISVCCSLSHPGNVCSAPHSIRGCSSTCSCSCSPGSGESPPRQAPLPQGISCWTVSPRWQQPLPEIRPSLHQELKYVYLNTAMK